MAGESCNLGKDEAEIIHPPPATSPSPPLSPLFSLPERPAAAKLAIAALAAAEEEERPVRFGNRCSSCRKRVGLTGFRCRCGDLFCGRHRYSDFHDCSFDYKAAGRAEITKNNPVVRAAKIIKI